MKTPVTRIAANTLRLSNKISGADTDKDGNLSATELQAASAKLPDNVKTRLTRAVEAGGGSVAGAQKALADSAVKVFTADRNHDGFISNKEARTLGKGTLERSLMNRGNDVSVAGQEKRALRAGEVIGSGLTAQQVETLSKSDRPADRMAAQAWKDGGGTVDGARQQLAQAIGELDQADTNKDGRLSKDEAAQLQSEVAKALFAQTLALRGRW